MVDDVFIRETIENGAQYLFENGTGTYKVNPKGKRFYEITPPAGMFAANLSRPQRRFGVGTTSEVPGDHNRFPTTNNAIYMSGGDDGAIIIMFIP